MSKTITTEVTCGFCRKRQPLSSLNAEESAFGKLYRCSCNNHQPIARDFGDGIEALVVHGTPVAIVHPSEPTQEAAQEGSSDGPYTEEGDDLFPGEIQGVND